MQVNAHATEVNKIINMVHIIYLIWVKAHAIEISKIINIVHIIYNDLYVC